jgi:hypothetical protein
MPDTAAIITLLRNSSVFFTFATRYTATIKSLPADFRVNDSLLDQFQRFAIDAVPSAALEDPLMEQLQEMEQLANRENYGGTITRKLASLRNDLVSEQHSAFVRNRDDIRRELYTEIVGRFHGQRQRLESAIPRDHQLQSAATLLRSGRSRYGQFLTVK